MKHDFRIAEFPRATLVALEPSTGGVAKFRYIDGPPSLIDCHVFGKPGIYVAEGQIVSVPFKSTQTRLGDIVNTLDWVHAE